MFKKLCSVVLLLIILSASILSNAALPEKVTGSSDLLDDDYIYSADTQPSNKILVTITRPNRYESTFKRSYVLCGVSEESKIDDIVVKLLIYDKETKGYIDFTDTEGESSWELGKYGVLIKEIDLPQDGLNKLRIVAYHSAELKKLKASERNKNIQISDFSITVLKEDIKDKIKNGISKITDFFKGIFK
ncbi:MAG: hypothetical protein Q8942_06085 [Bacillota bacterium]|nr:hypothetical protein [Bacillota bacterium]